MVKWLIWSLILFSFVHFGPLSFSKFILVLYLFKLVQIGPSVHWKLTSLIILKNWQLKAATNVFLSFFPSPSSFFSPFSLILFHFHLQLNNIQQKSSNLEYQSHPQSKTRMHNPKNKNEWSQNVEKLTQNEPLNFSIRIQSNFLPYFLPLPPSLARSNSQCTWHPCAPQCLQRVCQARDLASKFVTT